MNKIAILGLGAMGSRVAINLLAAGYEVIVWNRSPQAVHTLVQAGAMAADSPQEAAVQASIVISMVTDDPASQAVWLDPETGAAQGLAPEAIAIESSSLTVGHTQTLATEIEQRGAAFLAAPVVGSRPQAEAQQLIYLVGGKAPVLAKVQDVLSASSSRIHHVGTVGQSMAMKLAVNALFGVQVAAVAEIISLLNQQGIPLNQVMATLKELPVTSPAVQGAGNLMITHAHAPLFPISLVEKDIRYGLELAKNAVEEPMPTLKAVQNVYQDAIAQGYGNDNITGVIQLFMQP
ncbi:3-hydroxyisobutyrate dehydrogenase, putative [Acaryochloris marina MBIC11017]|uniref:3-hydroxyisobutyrate dehydrogenase, putative n=2 Tax=Acaryochloris marina TaxID=155978 RepID=B0CBN3_ACAM1|nr:3-hydroxyisobutyrate dehydrogenase, putative [Acaryochloris marina MBIC11017]BDM78095.1 3-hydroxyisobutyrate dehydrogenase [Acaryochloris marina MBIC10699]